MAVEDSLLDSFYRRLIIVNSLAVFWCCYFVFIICPLAYAFYSVSLRILFRFSAHFIPSLRAFYSVSLRIWLAYFRSIVRSDLRWG